MARFRRAGLVLVGTTQTPELGYNPTTETVLHGPVHNPWMRGRSAGGSSGGSAAAVAAGIVPIAHANDGGGSIRIPASCNGLVGLKPTRDRTPTGPDAADPLMRLGHRARGLAHRARHRRHARRRLRPRRRRAEPSGAAGASLPRGGRSAAGTAAHRVHHQAGFRHGRSIPSA